MFQIRDYFDDQQLKNKISHFIKTKSGKENILIKPVDLGKCGMSVYGITVLLTTNSAKPPRPEPQIIATSGLVETIFRINETIS